MALKIACQASVSVQFWSKEKGTRVKERVKNGTSKERRGGAYFLPSPPSPPSFIFDSRSISRAAKTEYPIPRSFFAPKPHGKAYYAGYVKDSREWRGIEREGCSFVFVLPPISEHVKEYDQSFFKEFLDMLSQNSGKK